MAARKLLRIYYQSLALHHRLCSHTCEVSYRLQKRDDNEGKCICTGNIQPVCTAPVHNPAYASVLPKGFMSSQLNAATNILSKLSTASSAMQPYVQNPSVFTCNNGHCTGNIQPVCNQRHQYTTQHLPQLPKGFMSWQRNAATNLLSKLSTASPAMQTYVQNPGTVQVARIMIAEATNNPYLQLRPQITTQTHASVLPRGFMSLQHAAATNLLSKLSTASQAEHCIQRRYHQ